MKKFLLVSTLVLCVFGLLVSCGASSSSSSSSSKSSDPVGINVKAPETQEEKGLYSIGGLFYKSNKSALGLGKANLSYLLKGLIDASNGEFLYDDEEAQKNFQEHLDALFNTMKVDNLEKAEGFLSTNKNNEGVIATDSGLQYKVLTEGTGASISEDSNVEVYYKLSDLEGNVIEEVGKDRDPISFQPLALVPGIKEGLCLMKEGSKYLFWVHPDLGYGENGTGNIQPNQILVFEFEVVKVN